MTEGSHCNTPRRRQGRVIHQSGIRRKEKKKRKTREDRREKKEKRRRKKKEKKDEEKECKVWNEKGGRLRKQNVVNE